MDKEKIVYKNRLGQFLKEHPDIKKNIVTQGEGLYMFNMQLEFPSHWEKYDDEIKHELRWYFSICSSGESERILNPNNINDYLLKMRADSILSNIRITRVICKRAEHIEEEKWNLNDQFDDSIIDLFKKEICDIYKQELEGVNYGTLFSDKPNGSCIKNDYGILIVFSEALKMFLYFMNFYFFNYDEIKINIKRETKIKSLLIALRIMTFKESFDFEIDERGEIPLLINNKINEINKYELFFILAHECAHVILGHLNDNIINKYIFYQDIKKNERIEHYYEYSSMKRKEYEADNFAIDLFCGNDVEKQKVFILYAITSLAFLDIFYYAKNIINNRPHLNVTHPSAEKRFLKLIKRGRKIWGKKELKVVDNLKKNVKLSKELIKKIFKENPSLFTTYGSIYLDQWKYKIKIDRVDF